MKPHEITAKSRRQRKRKRLGRGEGSTHGKTSGRGMFGQGARSGGGPRLGFEGGQTPLAMRSPARRGFTNARFRVEYQVVNVGQLGVFPADAVVGPAELRARRLIDTGLYKVLGDGELEHALTVRAPKFSGKAKSKIQEAGGSIEEIAG